MGVFSTSIGVSTLLQHSSWTDILLQTAYGAFHWGHMQCLMATNLNVVSMLYELEPKLTWNMLRANHARRHLALHDLQIGEA